MEIIKYFYTTFISYFINNFSYVNLTDCLFSSSYNSSLSSEYSIKIKNSNFTKNLSLKLLKKYSELLNFVLDQINEIIKKIDKFKEKSLYLLSSLFKLFKPYNMDNLEENLSNVIFMLSKL